MWGTFLLNYKNFSCQSCCFLLLLKGWKNHYRKENRHYCMLAVVNNAEMHFFEFTYLLYYIYFTLSITEFPKTYISICIKLFIRHPVLLFGILILSEQFDGLVQLPPWCTVKERDYVFINTSNTELYIPLLLRQNKSRCKIWHWLELGHSCQSKQSTNKEI